MSKIVNIAESLARLYDEEVVRLDIQYNLIKHKMVGYLALGTTAPISSGTSLKYRAIALLQS